MVKMVEHDWTWWKMAMEVVKQSVKPFLTTHLEMGFFCHGEVWEIKPQQQPAAVSTADKTVTDIPNDCWS